MSVMLDYSTGARALGQVEVGLPDEFRRPELRARCLYADWAAGLSLQEESANYSSWARDARIDG